MRRPEVHLAAKAPAPEALFADLTDDHYALWLDSVDLRPDTGRFSFLALDPFLVVRTDGDGVSIESVEGRTSSAEESLAAVQRLLRDYPTQSIPELPPFQGGAAGYFGYELSRELERVPETREPGPDVPAMEICFYDLVAAWDHVDGTCWIISSGWPHPGRAGARRARSRLAEGRRWIKSGVPPGPTLPPPLPPRVESEPPVAPGRCELDRESALYSSFSSREYREAVAQAIEYILAGDVFQVNLSQRFELPAAEGAGQLYTRLRRHNPAPFGAFFAGQRTQVLSSSPERFLRCTSTGEVETRPIKGTRPRGADPETDRRLARELASSRKDLAENLMIVDLLRNDLSRVCRPGSVAVPELFRLESYETVHHLVSVIRGRLEAGLDATDLLTAAFPGGSVTGAPKIRAMEIISELEPVPRGPYCGAIGYIGFDGSMDTSIAIRTIVRAGGRCFFHAGGAVVADSVPADEYEETVHKAAGMLSAFGLDPAALLVVATRDGGNTESPSG